MLGLRMAAASAVVVGLAWASSAAAESGKAAWSYEGDTGPATWGKLSADYAACESGRHQSPIDLDAAAAGTTPKVAVDYRPLPLTILNNGHTVEVVVANGSRITLDGKPYELLQFHFHTPSEHVVGGEAYPLEAHFVHRAADGELAVIGVLFEKGAANRSLAKVIERAPAHKSKPWTYAYVTVEPGKILPPMSAFWSYDGSLTTPPCSEGVRWMVQKTPAPLSAAHVAAIAEVMGANARPVQPLNGRSVAASR